MILKAKYGKELEPQAFRFRALILSLILSSFPVWMLDWQ